MPEKAFVEAALARDLWVKRGAEKSTLLNRDDATIVEASENLNFWADLVNHWRANEHRVHRRLPQHRNVERCLERIELVSEGVASHSDIEPAERLLPVNAIVHTVSEHDQASARAVHRHAGANACPQRLL